MVAVFIDDDNNDDDDNDDNDDDNSIIPTSKPIASYILRIPLVAISLTCRMISPLTKPAFSAGEFFSTSTTTTTTLSVDSILMFLLFFLTIC